MCNKMVTYSGQWVKSWKLKTWYFQMKLTELLLNKNSLAIHLSNRDQSVLMEIQYEILIMIRSRLEKYTGENYKLLLTIWTSAKLSNFELEKQTKLASQSWDICMKARKPNPHLKYPLATKLIETVFIELKVCWSCYQILCCNCSSW